jgi:hypothetical protein
VGSRTGLFVGLIVGALVGSIGVAVGQTSPVLWAWQTPVTLRGATTNVQFAYAAGAMDMLGFVVTGITLGAPPQDLETVFACLQRWGTNAAGGADSAQFRRWAAETWTRAPRPYENNTAAGALVLRCKGVW